MTAFAERYGPWALILGGSEGIGAALAEKLAQRGLNLVLVARKPEPLAEAAAAAARHGVQVRTLSADLSQPASALAAVRAVTDPLEIGLMVYMAGANLARGPFIDLPLEPLRAVVQMNVLGQMEFTHHYAGLMAGRGRGGVILAGSLAGNVGSPQIAAYSAAKAFSRIFSEALWFELRQAGVDLLHLNINFTATPAMARAGYDLTHAGDPAVVAEEALAHLGDGPEWVAGGEANRAEALRRVTAQPRSAAVQSVVLPPKR